MFNKIYQEIRKHNKIIIIRHKSPDYDAYGSQLGLYYALKQAFPHKKVLVDGDDNNHNIFKKAMDAVFVDDYKDSLVFIVDASSENMLLNDYYKYADKIVILDHHDNDAPFADYVIIKKDYSSASELVTEFLTSTKINIPVESANALFIGIVGDSNRFLYKGTTSNTFNMAAILFDTGINIVDCYNAIQRDEKESDKRFRGFVLSSFKIKEKVAYIYISKEDRLKYDVSDCFASRGTINLLSGIEGVEMFVNFTEMDTGEVNCEFRSKEIPVLEVAKSYGGGGHALASGARIAIGYDYMEVVDKMNEVIRG